MRYQRGHDRLHNRERTLLEQYADESIVTFWHTYKGKPANYNHDLNILTTVNISNAIVCPSPFFYPPTFSILSHTLN